MSEPTRFDAAPRAGTRPTRPARTARRRALAALALLCAAGGACTLPPRVEPEAAPLRPVERVERARATAPAGGEAEEAASERAARGKLDLIFVTRSRTGRPVPVYSSMDPDARVAFELAPGFSGDVLSTATLEQDGRTLTYYEILCEDGHGWIWDGHADARTRPSPAEVAAVLPPPSADRVAAHPIDIRMEIVDQRSAPGSGSGSDVGGVPDAATLRRRASDPPDVATINEPGQSVVLADHLVSGQYTIIDVFSPRCGPCVKLAPQLERFAAQHPLAVLRTVNIDRPGAKRIDWGSPAALQFGARSIPYVEVYDPQGALVASGDSALSFLESLPRK